MIDSNMHRVNILYLILWVKMTFPCLRFYSMVCADAWKDGIYTIYVTFFFFSLLTKHNEKGLVI